MSSSSERVRALVREGKIGEAEAAELLAAVRAERAAPATGVGAILLNPFERFGGGTAAAIGLLGGVISVACTRHGVQFDGFLDMHAGKTTLRHAVTEQAIDWLIPSLVFFGFSWALGKRGRLIDFVGVCGLARFPYALVALPTSFLDSMNAPQSTAITPSVTALLVLVLAAIGIHIYWLVRGYQNASGLTKAKLVTSFIAALIVAEILTKIALAHVA